MTKLYFRFSYFILLFPFLSAAQPCSGLPGANTVSPLTQTICAGSSTSLSLVNTYSTTGINYQWLSSTSSSVGPFSTIGGATQNTLATGNLTTTTWFTCIITCTNGGGNITSTAAMVFVQGTVTNTVPYYEGFSGLAYNNQLPNCSWSASNLGNTCLTYSAPTNRAAFYYSPGGANYFYTNGLQLFAGITYSASTFYKTDNTGAVNWTDISLLVGSLQAPPGLTMVASSNGPAAGATYSLLNGTFTVPVNGLYYVAIRGTGTNTGSSQYLYWDDLSVIIPCTPQYNTPTVGVSPPGGTLCAYQSLTVSATGADSYSWSTGQNGAVITPTVTVPTILSVIGTNTLTGCSSTGSFSFLVKPIPNITALAFPLQACFGKTVSLVSSGAATYTWSNNTAGPITTATITANASYTVTGSVGTPACTNQAVVSVSLLPNAVVGATASTLFICDGESTLLTGTGAATYTWASPASPAQNGGSILVTPSIHTTYTVSGTAGTGCSGSSTITVFVDDCSSLVELNKITANFELYPNPNSGRFSILLNQKTEGDLSLYDVTGKIIFSQKINGTEIQIEKPELRSGIYFVLITSATKKKGIKFVIE